MATTVRQNKAKGRSIRPPEGVLYSRTTFSLEEGVRHPRKIPLPAAPAFPVLSKQGLAGRGQKPYPSVLVAGKVVPVASGRAAIGLALQHAGIGPGHQVLVPAYHCREMITPVLAAESQPVFYKIQKDFAPDWDDIAQKTGPATKALLVVHYFGFPQKADEIQAFCRENRLIFIEDCAHAFFGSYRDRPLGSYGHYAIASTRKFFPIQEGGALIIARDRAAPKPDLTAPDLKQNLRQLKTGIEKAVSYGRLPALKPLLSMIESIQQWRKDKSEALAPSAPDQPPDEMAVYLERHRQRGMAKIARMIVDRTPMEKAAGLRRRNYRILLEGVSGLSGCRAALPELPQGCVPYLFPLVIDDLEQIFPAFEDAAIPMQRFGQFLWDGVDETICPVSMFYSQQTVQIACHQSLTEDELLWIVTAVRRLIKRGKQ